MDLFNENTENQNEKIKQEPAAEKKKPSRSKKANTPNEPDENGETKILSPVGEVYGMDTGGQEASAIVLADGDGSILMQIGVDTQSQDEQPSNEGINVNMGEGDKQEKPEEITVIKGLGDVVSKVTGALGIEECSGCEERKKKLNKYFPFTRRARRLTVSEIVFLNELKNSRKMTKEEAQKFSALYRSVFMEKFTHCDCPAKYTTAYDRFRTVVEYYKLIDNK